MRAKKRRYSSTWTIARVRRTPTALLARAILHLIEEWKAFYDEPKVVTEQDDIYYGPALDQAIELLRENMHVIDPKRCCSIKQNT